MESEKEIWKTILGKAKALQYSDSCFAEKVDREIDELLGKIEEVKKDEQKT